MITVDVRSYDGRFTAGHDDVKGMTVADAAAKWATKHRMLLLAPTERVIAYVTPHAADDRWTVVLTVLGATTPKPTAQPGSTVCRGRKREDLKVTAFDWL